MTTTDQPDPGILSDPERLAVLEATGLLDSEPEESFDRYTRLAARVMDADAALLALVTPERQFFKSEVGLPTSLRRLRETPLTLSLCKHTVERRSTLALGDLERAPLPEARGVIETFEFRSYAGAPLMVSGETCIGSLSVLDRAPRDWTEEETALLQDLAAAASSKIELRLDVAARDRAEREQERRIRQQAAVARLGTLALRSDHPMELMNELAEKVARGLEVDFAKVLVLEPDGEHLRVVAGVGWREGYVGSTLVPTGEGTQAGHALLTDGPVLVESGLKSDERFEGGRILHEHGVESGITLPIPGPGERPFGVLGAHAAEQRAFTEEDVHFVRSAANVLAGHLHRDHQRRQLHWSRHRYRRLLASAPIPLVVYDESGVLFANDAAAELAGVGEPAELAGRSVLEFVPPDERDEVEARVRRVLEDRETVEVEDLQLVRSDGETREVAVRSIPVMHRGRAAVQATLRDVTEEREARRKLERSEARYRRLFEDSNDAIYITDRDGRIIDVNPAGEELFGRSREELLGTDATTLYQRDHDRERFRRQIREKGYVDDFEVQIETPDGEVRDCLLTATVRTDEEGAVTRYQGIIRDVTERKAFEQELERRALHDPLTELPNRALLWDRLDQAVARVERTGGRIAVLFLDLDRFKAVNDSLGHAAGDQVLRETARRLESTVRDPDTVARVGGDEFTVLLEDLESADAVDRVTDRLIESLTTPFRVDGEEVHLDASIGVAHLAAGEEGLEPGIEDPEELVRQADAAMFRAKERTATRSITFDPDRDMADTARIQRENELRQALERNELVLHYQPIVDLETGSFVGVEPLVRWNHPERGLLAPGEFLPLAEETGLILPMGKWILQEACGKLAGWNRRFGPERTLRLHPNLSASQFDDPELAGVIEGLVDEFDLAPSSLVLEVTEHLVMRAPDRTRQLARLGVRLAVDDFGTGYSSLSHIRDLEVHGLKIDRSFLEDLGEDRHNEAIVTTILTLGETLDLEVVAEGIETERQLRWLRKAGCPGGQGFYFARPRTADETTKLLERGTAIDPGSRADPGRGSRPA